MTRHMKSQVESLQKSGGGEEKKFCLYTNVELPAAMNQAKKMENFENGENQCNKLKLVQINGN